MTPDAPQVWNTRKEGKARKAPGPWSAGFTLLEVLAALGIFALVSLLGYRGLFSMRDAEIRLAEEAVRWQRIENALAEVERDFRFAAPRGGRNLEGRLQPSILAVAVPRDDHDAHLSLTRFPHNDDLTNGSLQRVGYRFDPPAAQLLVWPNLDAAPGDVAERVVLFEGIEAATVRYQDATGNWFPAWPVPDRVDELPMSLEITLDIRGVGRITRLFGR